ncbi:MAG: hypothetical protein U0Q11_00600 [Vicinamibacterales bacterium]
MAGVGTAAVGVVLVVTVLTALGIANVVMRAQWHEVEDGVFWGARGHGITAVEVAALLRNPPASSRVTCCSPSTANQLKTPATSSNFSTRERRARSSPTPSFARRSR